MVVDPESLEIFRVIEYFSRPAIGEFYDPRKHAVSVTYSGRCRGEAKADGKEARQFDWFNRDELAALDYGFGQGKVISAFLDARR